MRIGQKAHLARASEHVFLSHVVPNLPSKKRPVSGTEESSKSPRCDHDEVKMTEKGGRWRKKNGQTFPCDRCSHSLLLYSILCLQTSELCLRLRFCCAANQQEKGYMWGMRLECVWVSCRCTKPCFVPECLSFILPKALLSKTWHTCLPGTLSILAKFSAPKCNTHLLCWMWSTNAKYRCCWLDLQ